MVAKVTKHNGTVTLTIELDAPTAERLQLDANSTPDIAVVGNRLLVTAAATPEHRERVKHVLQELDDEWAPVFKRLAE